MIGHVGVAFNGELRAANASSRVEQTS